MNDDKLWKQTRERAEWIVNSHAGRNEMFNNMERMFKLRWSEAEEMVKKEIGLRITQSPDPRNAVLGAIRLLVATDPLWRVGTGDGDIDQDLADQLEVMADATWNAAGRVRGDPIHYDLIKSAMVFGEFHIAVTNTQDLVRYAKGAQPAALTLAQRAAARTPFTFDVYDPREGYPEFSGLGMKTFTRVVDRYAGDIIDEYGDAGREALAMANGDEKSLKRYDVVQMWDHWDMQYRQVWIGRLGAGGGLILQEEHGLPFIPIIAHLVEGSRMFQRPEDQREPFLYGLGESGIWERQNLSLTAMYNMIRGIGLNPVFIEEMGPTREAVVRDFSVPGGVIQVPMGSKFYPLINKGIIDPAVMTGLEIAERKGEESTIFKSALGSSPVSGVAFSTIALMSQAGRLPLVAAQKKASWGIADAMRTALEWMRHDAGEYKARYDNKTASLAAGDIPEYVEIEAQLEINLPQDKLQMANIGSMLINSGLASRRWVRENILQIGQSEDMDRELWTEQASAAHFGAYMQRSLAAAQQQQQQMGPGPGGPAPAEMMMPDPNAMNGDAGQPMQGGLPPELAQMGGGRPVNPQGRPAGPEMMQGQGEM